MAATGDVDGLERLDVVNFLNSKVPGNVNGLSRCQKVYDELKTIEKSLKSEYAKVAEETPHHERKAALETRRIDAEVTQITETLTGLQVQLKEHLQSVSPALTDLSDLVKKTEELEKCRGYMTCVDTIEQLSCSIQSALLIDSNEKALDGYSGLMDLVERLRLTNCFHLYKFLADTVIHWHCLLRDRLNRELIELMKVMQWPFVAPLVAKSRPVTAQQDEAGVKTKLERLFRQLLTIQLPPDIRSDSKIHPIIASLPNYRDLILPMKLMIEPLSKRFHYHFYGAKQTNSLDKPEWFFTQLLTWVKDHNEFLVTVIQPILCKAGYSFVNASVEFMRGMHIIAMEKMISMIPDVMYDDQLFSHLIHEALSFHNDMCSIYDYPRTEPSCLHALTAEEPFRKWIQIEKKFALEKMDSMTESPTAWETQYNSELDEEGQSKAPECAENFITLLLAITERLTPLPYPVCQLLFVSMQQELLDDYRIRLIQLRKESFAVTSPQYSAILNTTYYIVCVLREWADDPLFVSLDYHYQKLKSSSTTAVVLPSLLSRSANYKLADPVDESWDGRGCLLQDSIDNILLLEDEMSKSMAHHIVSELQDAVAVYANSSVSMWTGLNHLRHKEEQSVMSLSASACQFLVLLQTDLTTNRERLHKHLFTKHWQHVISQLDELIFRMVICENHFSEGGVIQLNFDITRNLLPIIGKYTNKPGNFLKRIKESCQLLTAPLGVALSLKQSLAERKEDPIATIQEQGIDKLSVEEVEIVLSRRTDLLQRC